MRAYLARLHDANAASVQDVSDRGRHACSIGSRVGSSVGLSDILQ